jgi:hypothetical protein
MSIASSEPTPTRSLIDLPAIPPGMDSAAFPVPAMPMTYGYRQGKASYDCSQQALIDQIRGDSSKKIAATWSIMASKFPSRLYRCTQKSKRGD